MKIKVFTSSHAMALITSVIGVALPWSLALASGNLDIPHNDAWSHSRIAQTFAKTGHIELLGWNRSALMGQIVILGPFGKSIYVQQTFVALLALIMLLSIYSLLKVHIGNKFAGISILIISIYPGFGLLATSFMTDIPMYAAIFASLALAQKSFAKDSRLLLIFAVATAFWGTTVREQSLAALFAIFLTCLKYKNKLKNISYKFNLSVFLISLIAFGIFELWRFDLPGSDPADFQLRSSPLITLVAGLLKGWFNLSLVVGILVVVAIQKSLFGLKFIATFLLVFGLGLVVWASSGFENIFLLGYLSEFGSYAGVLQPVMSIFPSGFWQLIVFVGLILGASLFAVLIQSKVAPEPLLTIFTLLTLAGTCLELITQQLVFDRYLIAFLPFLLLILFANLTKTGFSRLQITVSAFLGSIIFLISLSLTLNSFAFDRVRWDTGDRLVEEGVAAEKIDAGLEWVGWHTPAGAQYRFKELPESPGNYWSSNKMFGNKPCYVLSRSDDLINSSVDKELTSTWKITEQISFKKYVYFGSNSIYVYRTQESDCS